MASILSSWKEIGQYLGKGVRTVQRWELEFGLPVRRPAGGSRHAVLAIPDELDAWTRAFTKGPGAAVAECLRRDLVALREETADLRRRLDHLEKAKPAIVARQMPLSAVHGPRAELAGWQSIAEESEGNSEWLRSAKTRGEAIRSRLSLAVTVCDLGEACSRHGSREQAEAAFRKARRSAGNIREHLARPGHVPADKLEELRDQLAVLESRIDGFNLPPHAAG